MVFSKLRSSVFWAVLVYHTTLFLKCKHFFIFFRISFFGALPQPIGGRIGSRIQARNDTVVQRLVSGDGSGLPSAVPSRARARMHVYVYTYMCVRVYINEAASLSISVPESTLPEDGRTPFTYRHRPSEAGTPAPGFRRVSIFG